VIFNVRIVEYVYYPFEKDIPFFDAVNNALKDLMASGILTKVWKKNTKQGQGEIPTGNLITT
jgi:ABC-type amino acid transport substrate-binding protein